MVSKSWLRNHRRRSSSIRKAFVKHGRRGYTIKGTRGFFKKSPNVW